MNLYQQLEELAYIATIDHPTPDQIDQLREILRDKIKEEFFFFQLANKQWLRPLTNGGFFSNPTSSEAIWEATTHYLIWQPVNFLKSCLPEAKEEVIRACRQIPGTTNPRIQEALLQIALKLPPSDSSDLFLHRMIEYARYGRAHQGEDLGKLVEHWSHGGTIVAALLLTREVIRFTPDPEVYRKKESRNEDSLFGSSPTPETRLRDWEYNQFVQTGLLPLTEKAPLETGILLIREITRYIELSTFDAESSSPYDGSAIWCPELKAHDRYSSHEPAKALIRVLTGIAEKLLANDADGLNELLDSLLREKWEVFERIRFHIYSKQPQAFKEEIRAAIMAKTEAYPEDRLGYEFAVMCKAGAEEIAEALLTEEESDRILMKVTSGPDRATEEEFLGHAMSEKGWAKRKRHVHRKFLSPVAFALQGKCLDYFNKISENEKLCDTEDYKPFRPLGGGGIVSQISPIPTEDLAGKSDDELLQYLNEWNSPQERAGKDLLKDISFEGLAAAFAQLIKENPQRFVQWGERWESISRPIYLRTYVEVITSLLSENTQKDWEHWIAICEHSLTRPASPPGDVEKSRETDPDNPDHYRLYRQVVSFLATALSDEVDVPFEYRARIFALLAKLTSSYDRYLDTSPQLKQEALTALINSLRGTALETVMKYLKWTKRHLESEENIQWRGFHGNAPEVAECLESRLDPENETSPIIWAFFGNWLLQLHFFDRNWVATQIDAIFPTSDDKEQDQWKAAWETFLLYKTASTELYDLLRPKYLHSLCNFEKLIPDDNDASHRVPASALGIHLTRLYWQGRISLEEGDLLNQYYNSIYDLNKVEVAAEVMREIGHVVRRSSEIPTEIKKRLQQFWEYRLREGKALLAKRFWHRYTPERELIEFTVWFNSDEFSPQWKLSQLIEVLQLCKPSYEIFTIIGKLAKHLEDEPDLTIRCFHALTSRINRFRMFHGDEEEAKAILRCGLNSENPELQRLAEESRDHLLRAARFEYMDLGKASEESTA